MGVPVRVRPRAPKVTIKNIIIRNKNNLMKIFDCTTYYNEDLILEVRFNILNKYVDKFLITEAKYSHSGEKKKLFIKKKVILFLKMCQT